MQPSSSKAKATKPIDTRVDLRTPDLQPKWIDGLYELSFTIINPHLASEFRTYASASAKGYRDHKYIVTAKMESNMFGIFVQPEYRFQNTTYPIVFRLTLHGDTPDMPDRHETLAKETHSNMCWGYSNLLTLKALQQRAKASAENSVVIIDAPPASDKPFDPTIIHDYFLYGKITIRFPSSEEWGKRRAEITQNPWEYLFLSPNKLHTPKPANLPFTMHASDSLHQSMCKLLERAPSDGDVTFIVGKDKQRIKAHEFIVRMATPKECFHQGFKDGQAKEADASNIPVDVFKALLTYFYTHQVSDTDLAKHALELLALSDEYQIPELGKKCEVYLCWKTQIHHHSMDIPATLIAADLHKAKALKEVCLECVFVRGSALLKHPGFDAMDTPLAIELLRDFAARRTVRSQFAEEEEEEAGTAAKGKRKKTSP